MIDISVARDVVAEFELSISPVPPTRALQLNAGNIDNAVGMKVAGQNTKCERS
ncbi:MAG TPA: hypothetical protein VGI60_07830 [Chthoniobacterales bacterium]